MTRHNVLAAALMTACLLTAPAVARPVQPTSKHVTANANITHSVDREVCCRNRGSDLRAIPERDVWGHMGAYYGPMVLAP
jgi:hypothetical protein